jgi:hypothetical protein
MLLLLLFPQLEQLLILLFLHPEGVVLLMILFDVFFIFGNSCFVNVITTITIIIVIT